MFLRLSVLRGSEVIQQLLLLDQKIQLGWVEPRFALLSPKLPHFPVLLFRAPGSETPPACAGEIQEQL